MKMEIVFVDDGASNRALMAMSLYMHVSNNFKKCKLPKAHIATTDKNKSMHMKGIKALKEFGLSVAPCSRKDVVSIEEIKINEKTQFIILGQDNNKEKVKALTDKKNVEYWPIDNPIQECKNEVKLRFFRRVRDQLWVKIENMVNEIAKKGA